MRSTRFALATLSAAVAIAAGCASRPFAIPPDVPATLRPPSGQVVFLRTFASGFQIYECAAKPDQPSSYQWTFRAPEAQLMDRSGRLIGRHYAGPTWEANDGSSVTAEVTARDPGPGAASIPWLLLTAKTPMGSGALSVTKSIQRVQTVGGVAPPEPCDAANANTVARVPYTATYYFYRAAQQSISMAPQYR